MAVRKITTASRRYSRQLIDALMSLFALELVAPAPELYLVSAWITDIIVLDNRFGQYRPLLPETQGTHVYLSTILNALIDRGVVVHVAARQDSVNADFVSRLNQRMVRLKQSDNLHAKILVNEHFCWEGSMNFTYSGLHKNPESVILTTESARISKALLDIKQLWETLA